MQRLNLSSVVDQDRTAFLGTQEIHCESLFLNKKILPEKCRRYGVLPDANNAFWVQLATRQMALRTEQRTAAPANGKKRRQHFREFSRLK